MNKNCGIYKITSPTGKVYIGQSVDISKRWESYKNNNSKGQPKIFNSLKKYGVENHQFDIIEYCHIEDLNCSERFWQDEFKVLGKNGLNCLLQECGEERRVVSEETKRKLSVFNTGKKHTKETKEKLSKLAKGVPKTEKEKKDTSERMQGVKNHMFGKKLTPEHKEKIKNSKQGKADFSPKLLLDQQTGIFFYSLGEAARAYGIHPLILSTQLKRKNIYKNLILI